MQEKKEPIQDDSDLDCKQWETEALLKSMESVWSPLWSKSLHLYPRNQWSLPVKLEAKTQETWDH